MSADPRDGTPATPPEPTFTVVIPTHNRSAIVPRAIASVLGQTLSDIEVVVVDDGSTDDTPSVLAGMHDHRIRSVRQENQGLSVARNTGGMAARTALLTFLDDDDQALPLLLERFRSELDDPACGIVCCGQIVVDTAGTQLRTLLPQPLGPAYDDQVGSFMAGTFAVRRELFVAVGGFAPGLGTAHGTELAFRLIPECLARGLEVRSIPEPGVKIEERPLADRPLLLPPLSTKAPPTSSSIIEIESSAHRARVRIICRSPR